MPHAPERFTDTTMLTPMVGRPAIAEAISVSKRFGATAALVDVTLAVCAGESHALVGRNGAGKSTLVSILTGLVQPDAGKIVFDGAPAPPVNARAEWQSRVACVYQRPTIVPHLSVAENLFLNAQPRAVGRIDWSAMRRQAEAELEAWGVAADVRKPAGALPVDKRQLVEIVRALRLGSRFIILDEPTAQLEGHEIERLFEHIRELRAAGVTFLYISHHLHEIYEVCDVVTVLRNGHHIVTKPIVEMPKELVVSTMVGSRSDASRTSVSTGRLVHAAAAATSAPALSVEGLTLADEFSQVSLEVARGEIIGLAGQRSSGLLALGETIVGLRKPDSGTIKVEGVAVRTGSVRAALRAGIGFVPDDRHERGFIEHMSVQDNVTMTIIGRVSRFGVINTGKLRFAAASLIKALQIRASPTMHMSQLSGGNQQKAVTARAVASEPKVLVLMHPTAGVDVRSKDALFQSIQELCSGGTAAVVMSDELDELRLCSTVHVVVAGAVVAKLAAGWPDDDLVAIMEGVPA